MKQAVKNPAKQRLLTVITSKAPEVAAAAAHTRGGIVTDADRIEAAVYTAMRLQRRISVHSDLMTVTQHGRRWEHYCDSRGEVNSICPEQVPS